MLKELRINTTFVIIGLCICIFFAEVFVFLYEYVITIH